MTIFVVDVEADGQCPGIYNMLEIGSVAIMPDLSFRTFYGKLAPITDNYQQQAIAVTGLTRDVTANYPDPEATIIEFEYWVSFTNVSQKPQFFSDNNGFDWQFVNYYFWKFGKGNPFGHSSTNINSLYKGLTGTMFSNFKHLRRTKHDHNPVNDAMGNAEALIEMKKRLDLKIRF